MSRCFPFPPPGYESKARTDHVELLIKEKHKEKKHKKEKRDKEKGERKEKKERDRSKDKHKEKKDSKEKRKDDKKEKNREKDQNRILEDRKSEEQAVGQHELGFRENSHTASDVQGLRKRLTDEEKGTTNVMVDSSSTRRRIEGMPDGALGKMEMIKVKQRGGTDGILQQKDHFSDPIKRGQGFGMGTSAEKERGTSNHVVANLIVSDKKNHATGRPTDSFMGPMQQRVEGKSATIPWKKERAAISDVVTNPVGKVAKKNVIITDPSRNHLPVRPADISAIPQRTGVMPTRTAMEIERVKPNPVGALQGNHGVGSPVKKIPIHRSDIAGSIEKERGKDKIVVPSLISTEERSNGIGRSTGKGTKNNVQQKEKIGCREHDECKVDGQSDRVLIEKNRDKERVNDGHKWKEQVRLKYEQKHKTEQDSIRNSGKDDHIHNLNSNQLAPNGSSTNGNIKKRKNGFETNGFLHENDARPIKYRITSPSPQLPLKNGTTSLDPFATLMPSMKHGTITNTVAGIIGNKEHKVNGITEPQVFSAKLRAPAAPLATEPRVLSSKLRPPAAPVATEPRVLSAKLSPPAAPLATEPRVLSAKLRPPAAPLATEPRVLSAKLSPPAAPLATEPRVLSSKLRPPAAPLATEGKLPSKPPHPDSKYLSQIYTVPKLEECPELDDDQDWLFNSDKLQSKTKARPEAVETPQVWSEAVCIESADVVALPYVVPF